MSFYGLLIATAVLSAVMLSIMLYHSAASLGGVTSSYYYQSSAIQLQAYSEMYANSGSQQFLNYTYAIDGVIVYQQGSLLHIPGLGYIQVAIHQNP